MGLAHAWKSAAAAAAVAALAPLPRPLMSVEWSGWISPGVWMYLTAPPSSASISSLMPAISRSGT